MRQPRRSARRVVLDQYLQVQRRDTSSVNAAGNRVTGQFAALDPDQRFWAQCRPRGGSSEPLIAGRLAGVVTWDIIVQDCTEARAIRESDILVDVNDASRVYALKHDPVELEGDRRYLAVTATTGGTTG